MSIAKRYPEELGTPTLGFIAPDFAVSGKARSRKEFTELARKTTSPNIAAPILETRGHIDVSDLLELLARRHSARRIRWKVQNDDARPVADERGQIATAETEICFLLQMKRHRIVDLGSHALGLQTGLQCVTVGDPVTLVAPSAGASKSALTISATTK